MEKFFLKYISSNIHTNLSLLFGWIILILFFVSIDSFITQVIKNIGIKFSVYALILFLWSIYWIYYRFCISRNKKNKVGIIIAIHTESNYERIRLKCDFVSKLKKNINNQGFGEIVNIIVLKNHFSEKLEDIKDVLKLHKKIKGHFYLWGDVKRRSDGEKKYFLNLNGMVAHQPVNINTKNSLIRDFVSILPKQISFFEAFEFRGFELTADIVYLAIKYITGIAAYISGDPFLAHKFHLNLQQDFNKFHPLAPHLQIIKNKIPLLLSDEELIIARFYYKNKKLKKLRYWLNRSLILNPNNYGGWLLKAIVDFLPELDNDPKKAMESIRKAKKYACRTHEWRYSRAFLYFWIGNYIEALRDCKNLSQKSYPNENITISEVEDFNLLLLSKYFNKVQLYFWLGYLNYIKKRNLPNALKYFERFEKGADSSMNILRQKSNIYLVQIRKEMKITKL